MIEMDGMMKTSIKEKIFLITFAALVLLAVLNFEGIYSLLQVVLGSMHSLFVGGILAFVLNVPMKKLEEQIAKVSFLEKQKRPLALVGVLIGFTLIVTGIVVIVLPTLASTISQIVTVAQEAIPNLLEYLNNSGFLSDKWVKLITGYLTQFTDWSNLSSYVTGFLSGLVNNVGGIFSNAMTLVMAFFITLAILSSKEHLQDMTVKFLQALLPEKLVKGICYVGEVIIDTYDRFLMSQIVEAFIIGTLVFVTGFLSGLVNNVGGIFSNAMTLVMAFFITLAILSSKEHLQDMTVKFLQALLPEKLVKGICYVGEVIIDTYDRFLMSQIVEAFIIGTLVFVTYGLCGIPYSAMAGILAGVLSFVPYIGPLTACLISALFVSVQSPLLALLSIVLFQVLQLVEGNVIYPRVVGQSVGLPTLFTLAAALIGGNLFGLLGMVFFTPIFAVVYRLVREWTYARLEEKGIQTHENESVN